MPIDPQTGPCQPWCLTTDLRTPITQTSPFSANDYIAAASAALFELSGRRFPGECTKIEWPTSARTRRGTCVTLDTPWRVLSIEQVRVDGAVVSPLLYEVQDWRDLVRLTDPATGVNVGWPPAQRIDAAEGEGSLVVEYTHGEPVPWLGRIAASVLACDLAQLWCNQPSLAGRIGQVAEQAKRAALASDECQTFLAVYPKPAAPVAVWWPEADVGTQRTWP